MSQLPLEGIRVTDATASWAGPYLTNMMGTLGAEIIKVDSLQRLDIWRPSATQLLSPRDKTWGVVAQLERGQHRQALHHP